MVDEAGVLDQDSAIALLTVAGDAAATVALVGDRAQLPAVGRGGVLDIAAAMVAGSGRTVFDLDSVHRFTDPAYADLTLRLRAGDNPAYLFDRLYTLGHVQLHRSTDDAHEAIAVATTNPSIPRSQSPQQSRPTTRPAASTTASAANVSPEARSTTRRPSPGTTCCPSARAT